MHAAKKIIVRKPYDFQGHQITADWRGINKIAKLCQENRGYMMMTQHDMAATAGVSLSTYVRLEAGETKYPRFSTVVNVLVALGFIVSIQKKDG